ncbi:unnamed protein product [Spirodela intermedia]|uniref:Uncharacterized protein n=2 Tax=Spirodela intermedia TaxID=51605 RepID=A0A7I8KGM6_SPIIN|nr:unnamed protein product [Spirodela intermedia]CAA6660520.1 unnamed protein product [Spirodela intermedia]CAA7396870.1 unnamed protein product [Spirodela intermedia]
MIHRRRRWGWRGLVSVRGVLHMGRWRRGEVPGMVVAVAVRRRWRGLVDIIRRGCGEAQ